jgi:hypothetical protein
LRQRALITAPPVNQSMPNSRTWHSPCRVRSQGLNQASNYCLRPTLDVPPEGKVSQIPSSRTRPERPRVKRARTAWAAYGTKRHASPNIGLRAASAARMQPVRGDAQRAVFFGIRPFCMGEERRICRASRSDFKSLPSRPLSERSVAQ